MHTGLFMPNKRVKDITKMTISEKLSNKKYKKPNKALYCTLTNVVVKSLAKKYGVSFIRHVDMAKYKNTQFILIGNHASRADYIYASLAVGASIPLNFILGRNEFYRSHLKGISTLLTVYLKRTL